VTDPWVAGLVALVAIAAMLAIGGWAGAMRVELVHAWEAALLYRDGAFVRTLPPGRHRLNGWGRTLTVARVPTGERLTRLGAIDVVSQDGFAFRLHLAIGWRVTDPRAAYEAQAGKGLGLGVFVEPADLFERAAAAAIAAVGTQPLDAIVAAPPAVAETVAARIAVPGVAIESGITVRLELPPETRRMLSEVERARREGLAALERARAEQAALRSLANAARLVRDNPELGQLRLLQAIEAAKKPPTIILGQPAMPVGAPGV